MSRTHPHPQACARTSGRFRAVLALGVLLALARPAAAQYQLVDAFPGLSFVTPLDIQHGGDGRTFVVEKDGRIQVVDAGVKHEFLDLTGVVASVGEAGLLGMTFPLVGAAADQFYVFYVADNPIRSVISRFAVSPLDSNAADPASEEIILSFEQPGFFHNGGQLAFNPHDGNLLISVGDWEAAETAQDLTTLGGSILRINVDYTDPGRNYHIPPDNPFFGAGGGRRSEIYAFGFRNPWRLSVDEVRNRIWLGDVGEARREEVDRVVRGRNYGWPIMEGFRCADPCDTAGYDLDMPVHEYEHKDGNKAIIGGPVYRGESLWHLEGHYVFADWAGGRIWALDTDTTPPGPAFEIVTGAPLILAIGTDRDGELLVAGGDGIVYRLVSTVASTRAAPRGGDAIGVPYPNPFNPATTIPFRLSQRGRVEVTIHDARGRRIRTLAAGRRDPGSHEIRWDGRCERGGAAASGVYFARLVVDGAVRDRARMVLIK